MLLVHVFTELATPSYKKWLAVREYAVLHNHVRFVFTVSLDCIEAILSD